VNVTLIARVLAWALLAALVVVTIGPIDWRPVSHLPVQLERALALALIGVVFAVAYPRPLLLVGLVVLSTTILLEALQLVEPSRRGRLIDAAVKLTGGVIGLAAGHLLNRVRHRS
jgi:VanZ family protein